MVHLDGKIEKRGILVGLAIIVFILLRAFEVVTLAWVWVLMPLWAPAGFVLLITVTLGICTWLSELVELIEEG